ncbi:hypothetical protein Poli38472_007782 [Pythium oligandrum]|uniref:peptidylprolyl isomerase n=1 Tax=Pythium oligandrum TaxID=41045 RepID=A0A8K1CRB4_PYTOL|nr:hypothetical protein Poli38472_007782 [Pythium oligandrum]|eukprot:TMW68110.1 hypothetical protein Poli38472_007782 [Pythium oligandrum]
MASVMKPPERVNAVRRLSKLPSRAEMLAVTALGISGSPGDTSKRRQSISAAPSTPAPQQEEKTTEKSSSPTSKGTHKLQQLTKLKIMTRSHRRRLLRKRNLSSTAEGEDEDNGLPGELVDPPEPEQKTERRAIGTFETKDVTWKAVIQGELEKFMYPSLRLESLYDTKHPPPSRMHRNDPVSASMPSPDQVDAVMANATNMQWELEKRYKNSTQSGPPNGHIRLDEDECKRLQFDRQLDTAEGLLRKQEVMLLDAKRQQRALESLSTRNKVSSSETRSNVSEQETETTNQRDRGFSLYEPHIVNTPQLIPRLPHTRKIIKEIQRHSSKQGQIKYYADKHHLFAKWKKLQVSELHKIPATTTDNSDDGDEEVDDTLQPFGKLSPRSLFFHECAKKNVLPEPIFSRIQDEEVTRPVLPTRKPTTFSSIASTLIQAVHEKHTNHEDLVPTADGKYSAKKHHLALHLQHFGLGDRKLDALSTSLQHFQSIHALDLSNNRLTDASIIKLLESLEVASTVRPVTPGSKRTRLGNDLRVLNLSQNTIGVAGCAQIARFLGICTSLTRLDLSHSSINGVEGIGPLTAAIESHRTLQVLNLSYNNIGYICATLVGDMLMQPSCAVTELNISWNKICKGGAIAIGRALRTNTNLKTLNLAMNRFSDDGAEQMAAALSMNSSLTELDLSRNNLGGRSAIAFGYYLRTNRSLQHLRLQDNRLGAAGAKALLHAVSLGSPCEFHMSAHDVESLTGQTEAIFDVMLPSLLSPYKLNLGDSPYDSAVAQELIDATAIHKRCKLTDVTFTDNRIAKKPVITTLTTDITRGCLVDSNGKAWKLPDYGVLSATATYSPPPLQATTHLDETACFALIRIIERGFSSRERTSLLNLALSDLWMSTKLASLFVSRLRSSIDVVEIVGRLWSCLVDGECVFDFLQTHLTAPERRRLIDTFGVSMIQFTCANPTGHWSLDLGDRGQRKLAMWFTIINAHEANISAEIHSKRTDSSQYGKSFNWRNVRYNRKNMRLTYEFFDRLPFTGLLEFDYVSTVRHEDFVAMNATVVELGDEQLEALLQRVGAEVCSIYIPLHKRKDLKYQLVFFHIAIANKFLTSTQAHRVLQYFPKNYETLRFKMLLAMHRMLIDMENLCDLLERLTLVDRKRLYQTLGYLNVVSPLHVDMDFEVDFERDDEKMLLRALVDLSMSCPMDMIRIESERSTVLVIYSMYQTNSVPAEGRIFFRYVSHPIPSRSDFLRVRLQLARHFLCGERLRLYIENALSTPSVASSTPLAPTNAGTMASPSASSGPDDAPLQVAVELIERDAMAKMTEDKKHARDETEDATATLERREDAQDEEDDDDVGPMPMAPAPAAKKRRKLQFEAEYLKNLPNAAMYERSYMHRDVVTHVLVAPETQFLITASRDGHVKFWKKMSKGIEFVKHYKAHLGEILGLSVSNDGLRLCSTSTDQNIKFYDVLGFDMVNMLQVNDYIPSECCWVYKKGAIDAKIVVADRDGPSLRVYHAEQATAEPLHVLEKTHTAPVTVLAFNPVFSCVISGDQRGHLEFWNTETYKSPGAGVVKFKFKGETDLYELAKSKTYATSIDVNSKGDSFVVTATDSQIRVFRFATGKLRRKYDESLTVFEDAQAEDSLNLDAIDFGRRSAVEKELAHVNAIGNCLFDESGHFILYPTLLGIKVVNLETNKLVRVLGKVENSDRFLRLALFQGKPKVNTQLERQLNASKGLKSEPIVMSDAASRQTLIDPTLFCTSFKRNRFFLFSSREPEEDDEEGEGTGRDVFNEKPTLEETDVVAQASTAKKLGETVILHTTMGDITIKLFTKECPKTIENFCTHARNGYYDNVIVHRVIKNFMIQTGDPLGDGTGGESIWGGEFEDEFHRSLRHDRPFTVSMANAGPGTNGSQFFITTVPTPWLDNKHTVFGRVEHGKDTVSAIENVHTDKHDRPTEEIKIINVDVF